MALVDPVHPASSGHSARKLALSPMANPLLTAARAQDGRSPKAARSYAKRVWTGLATRPRVRTTRISPSTTPLDFPDEGRLQPDEVV